ncbi:MAG: S-layer protein [Candidatus Aenigmarchaeota archaeon]|nr:S-layer protein [Candidatus Aenigmarchaeota archaeon]
MQRIKQVLSGAVGLLMSGATLLTPALADFTLDNFDTMTAANTVVVVGTDANAADIVGAINVGAAIAQNGATADAAAAAIIAGAESDDVSLGEEVNDVLDKSAYKDNDVSGLLDTKITWNSEDVDVEEQIVLGNGLVIMVSATEDEEFASEIVMGTDAKDAIGYRFVIDDSDFNHTAVDDSDTLEITMLGKSLTISKVTNGTTDSIKLSEGTETALKTGNSVEINGKTVEVTAIGSGSAAFKIGAETEFINAGDEEEIGSTGINVKVESILYTDDVETRQVLVTVGTDLTTTVKTDDSMETYGEPEDEEDAEWVWYVDADDDDEGKLTIGANHNQKYDEVDEAVVAIGGSIMLPNDYAEVEFTELTETGVQTYELYFDEVDFKLKSDGTTNGGTKDNQKVLVLQAIDGSGNGFSVTADTGTEESDYMYLSETNEMAFKNDDGDIQQAKAGEDSFSLTSDDTTMAVSYNATTGLVTIVEPTTVGEDITVAIGSSYDYLGATDGDADTNDVTWNGTNMAAKDDDVRTLYGTVIESPEDNADSDKVVLEIPSDQVKATVTIKGLGSTVETVAGGVTQVDLGNGIAKLASEAEADKTAKNLVLMGGPYANSLVEELAVEGKTPTKAQWADLAGKAIVQAIDGAFAEGKAAIVVAGAGADQTRNAGLKLMGGTLTGAMVEIQGDTVTETTYAPEVVEDEEEVVEDDETENDA